MGPAVYESTDYSMGGYLPPSWKEDCAEIKGDLYIPMFEKDFLLWSYCIFLVLKTAQFVSGERAVPHPASNSIELASAAGKASSLHW